MMCGCLIAVGCLAILCDIILGFRLIFGDDIKALTPQLIWLLGDTYKVLSIPEISRLIEEKFCMPSLGTIDKYAK